MTSIRDYHLHYYKLMYIIPIYITLLWMVKDIVQKALKNKQ